MLLFGALSFFTSHIAYAKVQFHKTENFWSCKHRVGGSWDFGRAPSGCDANVFGDDQYVQNYLKPIIYDDRQDQVRERARYMVELHLVIRDAATYYLYQRKPKVKPDELNAWLGAIFTTAYQESFWSHYRIAKDDRLKIMRGDSGHGHGIMQLDDRWHFVDIKAGKGWHIIDNLIYGIEHFYYYWQYAPKKKCVKRASDWEARARTAYAGYNGGDGQMCRWTKRNDRWAVNDKNFINKYRSPDWELYALGDDVTSSIDVICMIEGRENCLPVSGIDERYWDNRLLKLANGEVCVWYDEQLQCLGDVKDAMCLKYMTTFDMNHAISLSTEDIVDVPKIKHDRHELCQQYAPSLFSVGQFIQLKKSINMRTSPSGRLQGTIAENSIFQVLDFELRDQDNHKRYYRISDKGQIGYIYAGNKHSYQKWVGPVVGNRVPKKWIPVAGDTIKIMMPGGINLRVMPEGEKLLVVPEHAVLAVADMKVRGMYNQVYYGVTYSMNSGWIYGGQLLYDSTLPRWAKAYYQQQKKRPRQGVAGNHYWWRSLRECAGESCDKTRHRLIGRKLAKFCLRWNCDWELSKVEALEEDGVWVKVKVQQNDAIGWIRSQDIRWER